MMSTFYVYWMSDFVGKTSGAYTDTTKSNVMMFDSDVKALQFRAKLDKLYEEKGTYRGRLVTHVSEVQYPPLEKPAKTAVQQHNENKLRGEAIEKKYTLESIVGKQGHIFEVPMSVWNPDKWFKIIEAKHMDGCMFIRGDNTCWFNVSICEVREP